MRLKRKYLTDIKCSSHSIELARYDIVIEDGIRNYFARRKKVFSIFRKVLV